MSWARGLNTDKGVAPNTDAVLRRLETRRMALPETGRAPDRGTIAEARARMWASRWRRRWGGRHGRIRARDDVPLREMRSKVSNVYVFVLLFFGSKNRDHQAVPFWEPP